MPEFVKNITIHVVAGIAFLSPAITYQNNSRGFFEEPQKPAQVETLKENQQRIFRETISLEKIVLEPNPTPAIFP